VLEAAIRRLDRLGLKDAARDARAELAALGGGAAEATEARPARLYGRYEAVRPLASSARARLLEGYDRGRGERVALKVYATAGAHAGTRVALARLEADVLAIRAFDHPAIVPVRDFHPSGPTVVLAWMEGGSLEAWLARGPIAPDRAAEVAASVLSALGEAHRLGMLHRDVKPANVLFDGAGAARLTDFGAAHAADASATVTLGDLSVLEYLSPEQRAGREATVQSDVYAVGILLREMLAARHGEQAPALDARHEALLAWLTAPEPRDRAADAFQARDRILALPWPSAARPGPARAGRAATVTLPEGPRLEPRPDGTLEDAWTGRTLERVPLSEATLARARFFAGADHAGLQTVLRVDRDGGCLWLAACTPAPDRPLAPAELERLQRAVEALRAAGMPSPEADVTAVAVDSAGGVVLRFVAG
jgi:serine/threonine-protein kinase